MTSVALRNVTSSLASEAGPSPSGMQAGQTADLFGQPVAPASPSAPLLLLMEARKAKEITAIFGRYSPPSRPSGILQQSLANRLARPFNGDGGTAPLWTWRPSHTPLRRLYFVLTPSRGATKGKGSIGWPTPAARDGKDLSRTTGFLSARKRHSPSMATRLLELGAHWTVISEIYCLAMGYPSPWNVPLSMGTAMPSTSDRPSPSSKQRRKPLQKPE